MILSAATGASLSSVTSSQWTSQEMKAFQIPCLENSPYWKKFQFFSVFFLWSFCDLPVHCISIFLSCDHFTGDHMTHVLKASVSWNTYSMKCTWIFYNRTYIASYISHIFKTTWQTWNMLAATDKSKPHSTNKNMELIYLRNGCRTEI